MTENQYELEAGNVRLRINAVLKEKGLTENSVAADPRYKAGWKGKPIYRRVYAVFLPYRYEFSRYAGTP